MNHGSVVAVGPPPGGEIGSLTDARSGNFPGDRPRVAHAEHPARVETDRQLRDSAQGAVRTPPGLAALAVRRRLHRAHVAQGVRRPRPHLHGGADPPARDGAGEGPAHPERARRRHGRSHDRRVGDRGAEEALPRQDPLVRRGLVPGLLGAELGLGPRVAADARRQGRRSLRHQRPEGVDVVRPRLRLHDAAGADRPERAQAQGHHLLPARHEVARGDREAAAAAHGRGGIQRGVLRQRPRARVACAGRCQQRLGGRAHDADVRAARRSASACRCGCGSRSTVSSTSPSAWRRAAAS